MKLPRRARGTLWARITLYFSAVFLAALAVIIAVTGSLYSDKLTVEMNMVASQRLGLAGNMLDHSIAEIRNLYFSLIRSSQLQREMREAWETGDGSPERIRLELQRGAKPDAGVRSIIAISTAGQVLDPVYGTAPYDQLLLGEGRFDAFLAAQMSGYFSAPGTFPMNVAEPTYEARNTITYFCRYYDVETYEDLGYLAVNLTKSGLLGDLEGQLEDTFDRAYILDERDDVVYRSAPLLEGLPAAGTAESGENISLEGGTYTFFEYRLTDYPNWRIVGVIDIENVLAPVDRLFRTVLLVAVAVLAAVVLASFWLSYHITTPIRALGEGMKELAGGAWPAVAVPTSRDEISELVEGFNSTVVDLKRLTERVIAEQEEKKEIEVAMVQSQLDLLQSQITPHFIHNTLNTMKYMAKKQGNDELADLIVSFNALLRTSMSQENMFIIVAEEVENIRNYMKIQLQRYDVELDFQCDISKNAQGALLPKLILQPLVENSLFHGIVPVGSGTIAVSARTGIGRLWLTVWDNGTGIPQDKLEKLIAGTLPNTRGYNRIGLSNVSERLVLNYGDSSRLVIQSKEDQGTTISFSIPLSGDFPDDSAEVE